MDYTYTLIIVIGLLYIITGWYVPCFDHQVSDTAEELRQYYDWGPGSS